MENTNCVSFYENTNNLTAKTAVKERIYEGEFYTPEDSSAMQPEPTTAPLPVVKKKSALWIWGAIALAALLMAPTNKQTEVEP